MGTGPTKDHQLQERVGSQSVGSMNRSTSSLPSCIQPWHHLVSFLPGVLDHLDNRKENMAAIATILSQRRKMVEVSVCFL